MYFTQDTEDAIVRYNNTDDPVERDRIYTEHIHHPFYKLAENIYNTFKFEYFDSEPEDIMNETISYMVKKLGKFKPGKGKAFSYFSIVAKNYLILRNNKNYKRYNRTNLLSESEGVWELPDDFEERQHNREMEEFSKHMVSYWEDNLTRVFKKERDIAIADAILELFRRSENIENYNKKALYLLIREMTGYKTQYITKVVKKMKKEQHDMVESFFRTGKVVGEKEDFWPRD